MPALVSIVTISYNVINAGRKDFLRQCLESVHNQTYKNIEHIVIDGASNDGTLDILQEYADKGWIRYYSEPDSGIYDAMNKGIDKANGDYVVFLNSDDYFCSNRAISLSIEAILVNNADFSCATAQFIGKDTVYYMYPRLRACFTGTPFSHQTMFASKKMLQALHGFDENYKLYADYDLILRAFLQGYKIVCVDECISCFRLGGISSQLEKGFIPEMITVIEKNCQLIHKQAIKARRYSFLPKRKVLHLLAKMVDFPCERELLRYNKNSFIKYCLKQIIRIKLNQDEKCIRLLGITFWDSNKHIWK